MHNRTHDRVLNAVAFTVFPIRSLTLVLRLISLPRLVVSALVEEIYRAQQQRDDAMLSRLRSANEERDEALLKLQHLRSSLQQ